MASFDYAVDGDKNICSRDGSVLVPIVDFKDWLKKEEKDRQALDENLKEFFHTFADSIDDLLENQLDGYDQT